MRLRTVHILTLAAFLLALAIRMTAAAATPLSDREADLALQAQALARGQSILIGPHPAYLLLTALSMYMFSASEFVARFWPALAGALLVLLPALFQARLGRFAAVLLSFLLALDPGLLAVSTQVDGQSLAIFFALLSLGLWLNRRTAVAGVAGALALLSGPSIWPGVLSITAALWITRRDRTLNAPSVDFRLAAPPDETLSSTTRLRQALVFALITLFIGGTLFFTVPSGLSAMAGSLPAFLVGFGQTSGVSYSLLLIALLVYELLPLILGLWGGISGLARRDPTDGLLVIWWALALLLVVFYPGRTFADLGWSLIPLLALAARQAARLARLPILDRGAVVGQAALAVVILAYVLMTSVSFAVSPTASMRDYLIRVIGSLVMLAASSWLIAWGWGQEVSLRGLALGVGLLLAAYTMSAGWNASGLSGRRASELWTSGPLMEEADLLHGTIQQLTQWGPQQSGGPDLVVVGVPSQALRWQVRNVQQVSYVDQLPSNASPALVITPNQPDLALASAYRGQNFVVGEKIAWDLFTPADWFRWAVLRVVPTAAFQQDHIIFWARGDWFPGGTLEAAPIDQAAPVNQAPQDVPNPP